LLKTHSEAFAVGAPAALRRAALLRRNVISDMRVQEYIEVRTAFMEIEKSWFDDAVEARAALKFLPDLEAMDHYVDRSNLPWGYKSDSVYQVNYNVNSRLDGPDVDDD
jgi:hypothetical protein